MLPALRRLPVLVVLAAVGSGCGDQDVADKPIDAVQASESCRPLDVMRLTFSMDDPGRPTAEEAAAGYAEGGRLEVVEVAEDQVDFVSVTGDGRPVALIGVSRLPGSGDWVTNAVTTCAE